MSSSDNPKCDSNQASATEELQITFPGTLDVIETFKATQIALDTYRLENSSVLGEVYYGDVVEVLREEDGKNRLVRVVPVPA